MISDFDYPDDLSAPRTPTDPPTSPRQEFELAIGTGKLASDLSEECVRAIRNALRFEPRAALTGPPSQERLRKLISDWRTRAEPQAPDYPSPISRCCAEEIVGCASELEDELEGR